MRMRVPASQRMPYQIIANRIYTEVIKWIKACVCHFTKRKLCLLHEMS
jgi:hypothetical protein